MQYGFGPVTDLLLEHDLLDELRLWVHPFLLGAGGANDLLFRPERAGHFEPTDVTTLASGTVILTYCGDLKRTSVWFDRCAQQRPKESDRAFRHRAGRRVPRL